LTGYFVPNNNPDIFRVTLFTGFIGGAYWSEKEPPIPYPLPFGAAFLALLRYINFTMIQTCLEAEALLMDILLGGLPGLGSQ
jgi:hypothetical protein